MRRTLDRRNVLTAYGSVFGRRHGRGSVRVLALHGWGRDSRDFHSVMDGLSGIALDLPGFGASPPPDVAMGASGYAEAIRPIMEEFADPPVVVGHSFGGRVAVCLAAVGVKLAGLVLTGVPLVRSAPARRPSPSYRLIRRLHAMNLMSDRRLEQARNRHGSADYRAAEGIMREVLVMVLDETYEREMSAATQPVVLVWGEADSEVPPAVGRAAVDLFSDASLKVLPDVGHLVPREAPGALRRAIESLL